MYPIEINRADFDTLIRVPGLGITYAKRIMEARKYCIVTHEIMKKMKISLKRSNYFITCNGKYQGGNALFSPYIRSVLSANNGQISIFDSLY